MTSPSSRVAAVDLLRGVVMVLMSVDHVRVFSGLPASGVTPGLFITRWITHFCAPTFVFLAGVGAYLYSRKHSDVTRFLLTRGLWLVVLELTVIRASWSFNTEPFFLAGVIWAIGWSMVLLALLARAVPPWCVGVVGLVVVFGHNLADAHLDELIPRLTQGDGSWLWKIVYFGFFGGPIAVDAIGAEIIVLYSLVPWVGVMACGFAFGAILSFEPERRARWCVAIGGGAIALFLALRGLDLYGDPRPWSEPGRRPMQPWMAFLNTTKYPASLSFVLMTLGPMIAVMPIVERWRGRVAGSLAALGREPLFYYLLHIPLIHGVAIVVSWLRLGHVSPSLFASHPVGSPAPPEGYTWGLPLLYGVVLLVNVVLFGACRWFGRVKATRGHRWLRYL